MSETLAGYCYRNPEANRLGDILVVQANPNSENIGISAINYQQVIHDSLKHLFKHLDSSDIAKTANPLNPDKVEEQMEAIKASGGSDQAVYLEAHHRTVSVLDYGYEWDICGVGKAKYADSRPSWRRHLHLPWDKPNNLADIGDVYVSPQLFLSSVSPLKAGIGSALIRSMLDVYPDDMTTVFYDFPELNPRIKTLAADYGFEAQEETRSIEFCGQLTSQVLYTGPVVKELAAAMEERRPWLAERRPVELRA